jgi:hypothetical protein
MKLNQKFVTIKGPFDFFTPQELEKLKPFENLYFTEFIDFALPFQTAAQSVRFLLDWDASQLPPTPYEVSDAVIRILGKVWWKDSMGYPVIEPYFINIFVNDLCDEIPSDVLCQARDNDMNVYEQGIMHSSLAVFLALHFGQNELSYLNKIRKEVFSQTCAQTEINLVDTHLKTILKAAIEQVASNNGKLIQTELFKEKTSRTQAKFTGRMNRIKTSFAKGPSDGPMPSAFGERGIY